MANEIFKKDIVRQGIAEKLGDDAVFLQLADVEFMEGEEGGQLKVVTDSYVGDSTVVEPGTLIPLADFTQAVQTVNFKKYGKRFEFTMEDIEDGLQIEESVEKQGLASINAGFNTAILDAVKNAQMKMEVNTGAILELTKEKIAQAQVYFGEEYNKGKFYLLVSPQVAANLRIADGFTANVNGEGTVLGIGNYFGVEVVVANAVADTEAVLVREKAIAAKIKRIPTVKSDEDISDDTLVVTTTGRIAAYIADAKGALYLFAAEVIEGP